jgi:RNA polymerase sigma-70 factor (ECF subfamily)
LSTRNLEELYRAHGGDLLAYLRRSFGRCASPEDMLQETFVQALRKPQRLARAASPRAWLFGIARHVGLTALRRHRHVVPLDEIQPRETPPSTQVQAVRLAIAALPDAARETLELRLRERLSYEEIAQMLDIPIGTVRSRLHHAMRQLRQALEVPERKP